MKKLFIFGDSYSDWCNKDEKTLNGETLRKEDFWFQKLADYKNLELWNYGRSGYGAPGCFREFMSFVDEITEDDLVIFGLSWWERYEIHGIGYGYNHNAMHGNITIRTKEQLKNFDWDNSQKIEDFWNHIFNIALYNYIETCVKARGLIDSENRRSKNFVKNVCEVIKDKNLNIKFWTLPELPSDAPSFLKNNLIDIEGKESTFDWLLKNLRYIVGGHDGNIDWHFNREGHEKFFQMVKDKV